MKIGGLILLATFLATAVNLPAAAKDEANKTTSALPADASAKKACANSTGQTKIECEKVAAKIDANTVEPRKGVERDELSSQDVRHSSAVVAKPDESATKPTKERASTTPSEKTESKPR